jgi:hypothetical protein
MITELDEFGPIDYLVVEFAPGKSNFDGVIAGELSRLVDAELIRVLDLVIVAKDVDGTIEVLEIDDLEEVDELRSVEMGIAEILAEEDIVHLSASMEPGTVAGVLVWENTWAAPFSRAIRHVGGQLVATDRIPIQALIASFEADVDVA